MSAYREFGDFRGNRVDEAPDRGVQLLEESLLAYPNSHWRFAQETKSYSEKVREEAESFLRDYGISERTAADLADLVGWEVRNEARRGGMHRLSTANEGGASDETIPEDSWGWDTWEMDFYRSYQVVDRLTDFDWRSRLPRDAGRAGDCEPVPPSEYIDGLFRESRTAVEKPPLPRDRIGRLNLRGIYVIVDDWIAYIEGDRPPSIDERAYEIAVDNGIGG